MLLKKIILPKYLIVSYWAIHYNDDTYPLLDIINISAIYCLVIEPPSDKSKNVDRFDST